MAKFTLVNDNTNQFPSQYCEGEHDGKFTNSLHEARKFNSWREANMFNQNFGPDWIVTEIFYGA